MSISTIRRQVKNVAYNFSDAQVKVREATSNDPWGPSTALMSEIADLSHNPVVQQCRENIYSIETLRDFQHMEENRDQGMNVREKAKQMAALLADDERLKNERTRFMLTRNKFKSNGSVGHEGRSAATRHAAAVHLPNSELDDARPNSLGEEEMQMQLALALSKEESEKEAEMRKGDDVLFQLALEESRKEAERLAAMKNGTVGSASLSQSALDDLLSLGVGEMSIGGVPQSHHVQGTAWETQQSFVDPWAPAPQQQAPSSQQQPQQQSSGLYPSAALTSNDPWAPPSTGGNRQATADPFSAWEDPSANAQDPFAPLAPSSAASNMAAQRTNVKTPETFLGENSNLVNLDNLMGSPAAPATPAAAANPFLLGSTTSAVAPVNPFTANQRKSPTLNEMRAAGGATPTIPPTGARPVLLPQPLQPSNTPTNPFANY